jgi:cobalt-zinc-cadmium efflux system outer membrane protein
VLTRLLKQSPELKAAEARIRRAQAGIERERSLRVGDVVVHGGVGFNYDRAHGTGGWIGELELRFPLPVFDRNQGEVAAARAEADRAQLEARRLELALRARLAEAFRRYATARERAERLSGAIIPRAEQAHRLYLDRFRQMAAAYPQVLIAQRTLFQARAEYVAAIADVWHEAALIEGFLLSGGLDEPSGRQDGARGDAGEEHGA